MRPAKSFVCLSSFTVVLSLWACGGHGGGGSASSPAAGTSGDPTGTAAPAATPQAGVTVATLTPSSTQAQTVSGAAGSNVSSVLVGLPAGSLTVATKLTLREVTPVTQAQLVSALSLPAITQVTGQGTAVAVLSSAPMNLNSAMTVTLPPPPASSLTGGQAPNPNLAVLYKISDQKAGHTEIGLVPVSQLAGDAAGNIIYSTTNFGIFQVILLNQAATTLSASVPGPLQANLQLIADTSSLPSCGAADLGSIVFDQGTSQVEACKSSGWTVISLQGPSGAAGPAGAAGSAGSAGATGAAGPSAASGLSIYDVNGVSIGKVLAASTGFSWILFSNNAFGLFTSLGAFASGTWYDQTYASCFYTTANCTGTCYGEAIPVKGQLARSATSPTGFIVFFWLGAKRWESKRCSKDKRLGRLHGGK